MSDPFTPDVPGRGSWTLTGGLLPVSPKSKSTFGFYRAAATGEQPVGSAYLRKTNPDRSDSARSVNLGVKALQALLGMPAADRDGWFGARTGTAVVAAQKRLGLVADGIAGQATMRALLTPVVEAAAGRSLPGGVALPLWTRVVGGIPAWESMLDPAAVGKSGYDHGLAQINLGAHRAVTPEMAHDPWFALDFTVQDLRAVYDRWVGKTAADPIKIAVAHHNSPLQARRWAESPTGEPVFVPGREFQIDFYVEQVLNAW